MLVDPEKEFAPFTDIHFSLVESRRERIESAHRQTLEELAERGGLHPRELVCHLYGVKLFNEKIRSWSNRALYGEICYRMFMQGILVYKEDQ